jgi:hypothetical protein
VRALIALALLFEAGAFFLGAMLHLGLQFPLPFVEIESLRFALLEGMSGGILLVAFLAALFRRRRAWKFAVIANVVGVASIAYATTAAGSSTQLSHHRPMIVLLIAVLVVLSIPRFRNALENGRHVRRRKKILQTL